MPEQIDHEAAVARYLSLCREMHDLLVRAAEIYRGLPPPMRAGLGMPPHPTRYIADDYVLSEAAAR